MIGIEEAVELLRQNIDADRWNAEYEMTPVEDACGRILCEDVVAQINVPHFPKSAMDGYAVRAQDTKGASKEHPVILKVIGEMCAGEMIDVTVEENTAVRVMTGSCVLEGYDAVIRQEDTDYGMDCVAVYAQVYPFQNYCKIGEDILCGTTIACRGAKITSLMTGLFASLGITHVKTVKPVSVAVISTGTELIPLSQPLGAGKIYNSISYILSSKIRSEGLEVVSADICRDETKLLTAMMQEKLEQADILITTGAVSVGKKDIVPECIEKLGAKVLFKGVNIQPGTPTMASVYHPNERQDNKAEGNKECHRNKIILSLSGNPYAALANFEVFFWEIVAFMMGSDSYRNIRTTAILQNEYPKSNRLRRFIRAYCDGRNVYLKTTDNKSSVIANMLECNCFIDVSENTPLHIGQEVKILYFK